RGRVAVVAGATRGAGRGIAAALGEAGATVICSGRSSVARPGGADYDRPRAIRQTAQLVTSPGGPGAPVPGEPLPPRQVPRPAASTSWSTTSGALSSSRAGPLTGTPRSGSMT